MGRKGKWFGAVKRVFNPETKENNGQKKSKSMKKLAFGCSYFDPKLCDDFAPQSSILPQEEVKLAEAENEQNNKEEVKLAYDDENDHNKEEVKLAYDDENDHNNENELVKSTEFSGRSKEEAAAIVIQTEFRGYLARRALRALRGMIRLKSLTNSDAVKNQAASALHCMQTLGRVQAQIRSRRIKMAEENRAIQSQQELKFERELEKLKLSDEWDGSLHTKEQLEADLKYKQEAAIRRERALSYAHQWKRSSPRSANMTLMETTNLQWGWTSLDTIIDRNVGHDSAPIRSSSCKVTGASETGKTYARQETKSSSTKAAKSRLHSLSSKMIDTSSEKGLVGSVKRRLSFSGGLPSPTTPRPTTPRRHSGLQKV